MLALWLSLAFAQDASDCGAGLPAIAGTSGLANARTALTTNRQTYGASAFAERNLFQQASEERGSLGGVFAEEWNVTHNVARVPVYVASAGTDPTGCPEELLLATSPLDLMSTSLGFAVHGQTFGLFYASSFTAGQVAHPNAWVNTLTFDLGLPFAAIPAMIAAPVSGPGYLQSQGASAVALEWVGGGTIDTDLVSLRAGYAGVSRGLYAQATEHHLGLFLTTSVSPSGEVEVDLVDLLKSGVDRFDLTELGLDDAGESVGVTSAFYRDLPYGQEAASQGGGGFVNRLRSGHLYQEDIFRVLDVRFAYAVSPQPVVHEAILGLHSPGFYKRRRTYLDGPAGGFRVAGGVVQLPELYTLGVQGGTYASLRLDAEADLSEALSALSNGRAGLRFGIQYNDAEQLALYPFARNALSYRVAFFGGAG